MSAHTPHELHDEFPRDACVLHMLKLADTHFCNLAERYHVLNRAIHRIECEVEVSSDLYLTRLRRQRLALLDEIAAIIERAENRLLNDAIERIESAPGTRTAKSEGKRACSGKGKCDGRCQSQAIAEQLGDLVSEPANDRAVPA